MEDNRQEDLDLLFILRSIKKGFLNIVKSIGWLFDFSLKNLRVLSLFVIIAVGISLGIYFLKRPYYTSAISVSHIRVENDYCYQMINNLNSYFDDKNNPALAEVLGVSTNVSKEIKTIKFLPLNENVAIRYADSTSVMLPFKVEVEVYDVNILDSLQKGIMNYLESNEYAAKRKEIENSNLEKTEEKIKIEIVEIDSLKRLVNQGIVPRSTGNGIILGEPIDPVSIYKRGMELYDKELVLNKKKKLNNSFELMVSFNKTRKRSNSGKLFYIFMGCAIGYFIGLIYLVRKNHFS